MLSPFPERQIMFLEHLQSQTFLPARSIQKSSQNKKNFQIKRRRADAIPLRMDDEVVNAFIKMNFRITPPQKRRTPVVGSDIMVAPFPERLNVVHEKTDRFFSSAGEGKKARHLSGLPFSRLFRAIFFSKNFKNKPNTTPSFSTN